MEKLGLERTEEAFHRGIVQAVGLARHALRNSMLGQHASIDWLLILPALVGVQHGFLLGRDVPEDFLEHGANQVEHGSFACLVRSEAHTSELPSLMRTSYA